MTKIYEVWKIQYQTSQDPDIPETRYHHAIYVATNKRDGMLHHLEGNITAPEGMYYRPKTVQDPRRSGNFHNREFLGYTNDQYHPNSWNTLLGSLDTPPQQKAFNPSRMKTEPFKTLEPLTFYEEGEERPPLAKCTEWTNEVAIPQLRGANYLWDASTEAESSTADAYTAAGSSTAGFSTVSAPPEVNWEWDEHMQMNRYFNEVLNTWVFFDEQAECAKYWDDDENEWMYLD